jgi:hypothetical protein
VHLIRLCLPVYVRTPHTELTENAADGTGAANAVAAAGMGKPSWKVIELPTIEQVQFSLL